MKRNQFDDNRKKTGLWKTDIGKDAILDIIIHDRMPAFVTGRGIFFWEGHYHEDREIGLWKFYGEGSKLIAENIYIT